MFLIYIVMRKRSRSTETEVGERVYKIVEMILEAHSISDILQYSAENWNIQERMTRDYISRAKAIIFENQQIEVREKMTVHNARLELLLRRSLENGDVKLSFDITKEIDAFNGLKSLRGKQQEEIWKLEKSRSDREEDDAFNLITALY